MRSIPPAADNPLPAGFLRNPQIVPAFRNPAGEEPGSLFFFRAVSIADAEQP
jgi:hypothetical protein